MQAIEIEIKNEQKASEFLGIIGNLQQKRQTEKAEMNAKIALLKKEFADRDKILADKIQQHFEPLRAWAKNNRPESEQMIRLTSGTLTWRKSSSLKIENEESLIALLIKLKMGKYISQKFSLRKDALLADKAGLTKLLDDVKVVESENFTAKPKEGDAIKHKQEI
ncbi:MAG: hypothetical protein DRR16_15515 [Candidatus Parabeggiatoa sp. nov. 3]|nr:MAG: hypothetical protein DRQ99_28810 [Gammaproteobacteria bacterium]RKZ84159.1 MAG: hypothetical protein DRR16_15515 [Gammaproteobacteria bacterium]